MEAGTSTSDERAWVATLRGPDTRSAAAADLRAYLRRGLGRALAGRSLRPEDLDDFTQDALVRIIEHLDDFRCGSRFHTWAMAIAIRVAFTALRRRRHPASAWEPLADGFLESIVTDAAATDPPRQVERAGLLRALADAIDGLSDRQRTAVLAELHGVPSESIAEQLGTNRNALYKLHHDARKKLRQAILDAGFTMDDVRDELHRTSEER